MEPEPGVAADLDRRTVEDPWRLNELVRHRRLREQGRRPPSVNLAEGLALSEFLATFAGAARR